MAVIHDYRCKAHGVFESMTGKCPYGCSKSFVEIVYLQAPGIKSPRTANIDKTLLNLAQDFGLTDMNNQNGTAAVKRPDPKAVQSHNELMGKLGDTSKAWGQVAPGGVYQVGKGPQPVEGRAGGGAVQTIQSVGARADNAVDPLRPILQQPVPKVVAKYDAEIKVA